MLPGVKEVIDIISDGDGLLVDVLAKVGVDRDGGVVLVIHLLQENTSQSVSGFDFIEIQYTHRHGRGD